MYVVKPHCGSAHVKGKARKYCYQICSLFRIHQCKNGNLNWVNTGISTKPRRGSGILKLDGEKLAQEYKCKFVDKYGSLHNKRVNITVDGIKI